MESKKINKKFNSLFWCIIYSMPLFILIITYVGYLSFYKENQNFDISSEEIYIVNTELSSTIVPNNGYVENVYFNTNLSVEEVVVLLDSIDYTMDSVIEPLLLSSDGTISFVVDKSNGFYMIRDEQYTNIYFHNYLEGESEIGFYGWNPFISFPIVVNSQVVSFGYDTSVAIGCQNSLLSSLFSSTPFEYVLIDVDNFHNDSLLVENIINNNGVEDKSYYSLFDLSIIHTNNTFDGFVFEPLYNTFNDLLPKINFNNESLISKFVLLAFIWFIQGMFLHIFVDTLTLIPKMYHKLMERWL